MIKLLTLYLLSNHQATLLPDTLRITLKTLCTQLRSHLCNLIDTNWSWQSCHVLCNLLPLIRYLLSGMPFLTVSHLKATLYSVRASDAVSNAHFLTQDYWKNISKCS